MSSYFFLSDQFRLLPAHHLGTAVQAALFRFGRNTKVQVQVSFAASGTGLTGLA